MITESEEGEEKLRSVDHFMGLVTEKIDGETIPPAARRRIGTIGYSLALATNILLEDPTDEKLITTAVGDVFLLRKLGQEAVIQDATRSLTQEKPAPSSPSQKRR